MRFLNANYVSSAKCLDSLKAILKKNGFADLKVLQFFCLSLEILIQKR